MSPFIRLANLFRARPRLAPDELHAYAEAVRPLVAQIGSLYTRWKESFELESSEDDLANAASIQRWEAAGLRDRVSAVEPPLPLARTHAELVDLVNTAVRASQLLASGYRFNSSRARCDGHAMMLAVGERHAALCRLLAEQGVSGGPAAHGGAAGGW